MQQWVIGLLNYETNDLRLEIVSNRNTDNLKKNYNYLLNGNYIISVSDCWNCYNFINNVSSGYIHMTFNHSRGIYCFGIISTSRIESVYSELKQLIKKIFGTIKEKNFVYFLKESEFRRYIKNLNQRLF